MFKFFRKAFVFVFDIYDGFFLSLFCILPFRDETLKLFVFGINRRLKGSDFFGFDMDTPQKEPISAEGYDCDCRDRVAGDDCEKIHESIH